jgi:hypothetical protein
MWITEWMLSVMVRWMDLFTNRKREFSRFAKAFKSRLPTIEPNTGILPPLRVLDALLAEKSCQMPALICIQPEKTRLSGPSQVSTALPVKMASGFGVMEYWRNGNC